MSYTKHNYVKGNKLLASQLNEMDDQIELNEQTADTLVTVSNTTPTAEKNRVWVKATPSEIEIPTMEDVEELESEVQSQYSFQVMTEATNFCDLFPDISLIASIGDLDPEYVLYSGLSMNNGVLLESSFNSSLLFRLPYRGMPIRFYSYKVYALRSMPKGENNETLDVLATIAEKDSPSYEEYTLDFPAGTPIIFNYNNNVISDLYFMTNALGVYKSDRLELNGIQDTFARYSDREQTVNEFGNAKLNIEEFTDKLLNGTTGGFSSNTSYKTYVFRVPVSELTITCTNGFRAQLTYLHPNDITKNGYMKNYLYANSSSRIDTFTATYGDYVAISINKNTPIDLKTDFIKLFSLPTLKLDYMQSNAFYRYEATSTAKYIHIYYKSGDKWVKWELHNVPASASHSDTWQIGHVCGLDGNLDNLTELVEGGEFEIAFKEHGAADYCGGNNHGDETTNTFLLHIDGKAIPDLSTLDTEYHAFNRIDAFEIATINRCDIPEESIATHQKIWTFENGTVKVRQTIKFLENLSVDGWLCTMFKAKRSAFPYGIRQGSVAIEDMHENPFDSPSTTANEIMYFMYGDNATAKITAKTMDHTPEARLWIDDQSTANKLYYTFFGSYNAGNPGSVEANSVYYLESEYDVAYT